ncbi:hypothetical protein C8T65DRAFT_134814 [Cerioporus squamosus]|nr:hypothetical protein C8T65DRAFT_134814 [Cerioporus squamosus]
MTSIARGNGVATKASTVASRPSKPAVQDSESDNELALLSADCEVEDTGMEDHELRTAPLFTREAYKSLGHAKVDGQYGVLGRIISTQYAPPSLLYGVAPLT